MGIFKTNAWEFNNKKRVEQLNQFLEENKGQPIYGGKIPIYSLGIINTSQGTYSIITGESENQVCKPGDVLKCNFNYDIATRKCTLLIYVNERSNFERKNTLISQDANIFKSIDRTIRNISIPEKGKDYPLAWDLNTILKGNPEEDVLVSYYTAEGRESYPIKKYEFSITHILSTDKEELSKQLDEHQQTQDQEFKTLEKINEYIGEKIRTQLESKGEVSLDYKELTEEFNQRYSTFLSSLGKTSINELEEASNETLFTIENQVSKPYIKEATNEQEKVFEQVFE